MYIVGFFVFKAELCQEAAGNPVEVTRNRKSITKVKDFLFTKENTKEHRR
ncbi:MAG: hypothetical protein ACJAX7_000690 [Saprospiraceae bacterium]|jgi:hypothetical protein